MAKNTQLKVQPLHDRVIIEPEEVKKVTEGGIIIPDTVKDKPIQGKVIACGNGKDGEPMTVKVGDTVLYGKHAGMAITVEDKNCLIMRESDILAVI